MLGALRNKGSFNNYNNSTRTLQTRLGVHSTSKFLGRSLPVITQINRRLYSTAVVKDVNNLDPYWVTGFADAESSFSLKVSKSKNTISLLSPGLINRRLYSTTTAAAAGAGPAVNKQELDPYWVAGFCDGESSFGFNVNKKSTSKVGWGVIPNFRINLHIKDVIMLRKIHSFFGVGIIYENEKDNSVSYLVRSLSDINNIIIPYFDKYPLITKKRADYLLFKKGVNLLNLKAHLEIEGILEILNIKAAMNWEEVSDKFKINFPNIIPVARPEVSFEGIPNPNWFIGFIDAEGCFYVDINKAKSEGIFYTQISLSVCQHIRDEVLLTKFVDYLGCGRITKASKRSDITFVVSKFRDIKEKIIPFFHNYPLQGVKSRDYRDFCEIAKIIENKSHLTPEGFNKIKSLRSGMNRSRIFS